ncbi:MAG: hypothetical protein NTZ03_01505 [Actinobacteria bacterium]|nr:hypothetical protein [Actinomycetota bacterium]
MGRRHKRRPEDTQELRAPGVYGLRTYETHSDGEWIVQKITGSSATKTYRCPGCDHEIRPATPHVVAWPSGLSSEDAVDDRRHWHTPCWNARARRRPKR